MKTINRKDFLKTLGLAGVTAVAAPILVHCNRDEDVAENTGSNPSGNSSTTGCSVTNSETTGPYPTKTPSSLVTNNIVSDRTGVSLAITLTIQNVNASCAALEGAIVDLWHCDKDGNYSEYGSYTSAHFLRGRQTTNTNGQVSFNSIFPGWYNGRATHIHIHIYSSSGQSLLVTQIAFPEGSSSAVVAVNSATSYGYTKGMTGYTYNANDNVFSDGWENELCEISGSVNAGYSLAHIIKVSA